MYLVYTSSFSLIFLPVLLLSKSLYSKCHEVLIASIRYDPGSAVIMIMTVFEHCVVEDLEDVEPWPGGSAGDLNTNGLMPDPSVGHIADLSLYDTSFCGQSSGDLGDMVRVKSEDWPDMPFDSGALLPSQTEFIATVVRLHEMNVFPEVAALRGHSVATIADSTVCAAVHEEEA